MDDFTQTSDDGRGSASPVARIEAALGRIEQAAKAARARGREQALEQAGQIAALEVREERLREALSEGLEMVDALIAQVEAADAKAGQP